MKMSNCVSPENVEVDLSVPSKAQLLQVLAQRAGRGLGLDDRGILAALQNREALGSTGIGAGIAMPHAPIAGVTRPFVLVARLRKPVDFDSIDGVPVDVACLVLSPPNDGTAHLTVMSRLARLLRSPDIVGKLRAATTAEDAYAIITAPGA